MGGQLYLNNGQSPNRANVCVSGYQRGKENFALSNFDDNKGKGYWFKDPHLGKIWFPTSEHYLHFQKIKPEYKKHYLATWQNETSPGAILAGLRKEGSPYHIPNARHAYMTPTGFNKAWDKDKIFVQMQINAAKYQQSQEFRDSIQKSIDLGKAFADNKGPATIIEDTSSLSKGTKPEEEWGTGPGGKGNNILGNSQTAFAMMVQSHAFNPNSPEPELQSFRTAEVAKFYDNARTQYQKGVQDTLADVRKRAGKNQGMNQPDTSDLGSAFVLPTSAGSIKRGTLNAASFTTHPPQQQKTDPNHKNPFQKLFSSSQPNYVYSRGGHRRLVIQNNKIIGYEFKRNPNSNWEKSGDPNRFRGLVAYFNQSQQVKPPSLRSTTSNLPRSSQTPPINGTSQEASLVIRQMLDGQSTSGKRDIPLVSKGKMNGTFKMAFDNAQDAKIFKQLLDKFEFKGLSYYGEGEKYPIPHNGKELNHIVRFENDGNKTTIPSEALDFLRSKLDDNEKVNDIVEQMGFERPEPANRYTF